MTYAEAYRLLNEASLKAAGDRNTAKQEAQILLCAITGKKSSEIFSDYRQPIEKKIQPKIRAAAKKRRENYPIAYILRSQPFMNMDFYIEKGVLIPRQDTHVLVEAVRDAAKDYKEPLSVIECGSGSGIIGVTLCTMLKNIVKYTAVDKSEKAVRTTLRNASAYGVSGVLEPVLGDFFTIWHKYPYRYNLMVSNPPYISQKEYKSLDKDVKTEPKAALLASENGLAFYRRFAELGKTLMKAGSILAFEIGWKQAMDINKIFINNGYMHGIIHKDDCGHDRAMIFKV